MARRPSRAQAAAARAAAAREFLPIRFIADFDFVTIPVTTSYKTGMILMPPPEHRKAALDKGKAVIHDGK